MRQGSPRQVQVLDLLRKVGVGMAIAARYPGEGEAPVNPEVLTEAHVKSCLATGAHTAQQQKQKKKVKIATSSRRGR
jgi:hypothetical protein